MIDFTPREIAEYYRQRGPDLKTVNGELRGGCLIHKGKDPNFAASLETGQWFCHSRCDRGGDILTLEQELTGADFKAAHAEVLRIIGRPQTSNGHRNGTN